MFLVRKALENRGIHKDSVDIIMSGWREGTKKCYHSYIKKWIKHCDERNKDPFRPTADELIVFLTSLFNQGKGYSCINLARSAVATLSLGSKISVGIYPLVKKFVRGVFNRRPAFPRNTVTWDADIVLKFLKKWSPAVNLSLPQLTLKVVLLCLLLSGQRGQVLWLLDLRNITWSKTDIRCTFGDLLKTSAPNRHQDELVFGSFPGDKSLCVVHYLRHYKKRTCALRGSETKPFISWKAPHSGVSRDTIRRWTKMGLKTAGIDMSRFTAHSTRSASTSKAIQKLPLATILKTVGWRRPSTFTTFYKKPICEGNAFQNAVLSQN